MIDSTSMTEHTITPITIMDDDYNEYQLRSLLDDTDTELGALLEEKWPVEKLPQELLRSSEAPYNTEVIEELNDDHF